MEAEPNDLTDEEWERVASVLPDPWPIGRPRRVSPRAVVNALLHQSRTGCPWRSLPRRYPNPATVRTYYDRWRLNGTWARVLAAIGRPAED